MVNRFLKEINEQDRWSFLILAIVVSSFFFPFFINPNFLVWSYSHLGSDIDYRHWPDLIRYAESLRSGHLALWDPLIALGRPLAGDPGVLFAYPFTALFLFLPPVLAFNVFDAIHVFIAGATMFLFLRSGYNTSRPSALISGLAFAFVPKFIAHLASGHIGVIAGVSWAPLVLLGLKRAFDGTLLWAAIAGLALALQMPTHVQMPYYIAAISSAFWLWHIAPPFWQMFKDHSQWNRVRYLIVVYAVWLIAFLLLASFVIIPLLELIPFNSRASFSLEDANVYALMPSLLLTLLAPTLHFRLHEWTIFLGVVPPVLAIIAVWCSPYRVKWLFGALAIFALIFALGTATPLFGIAFYLIPGFQFFRVPTRLWFFGEMAVIILAGFGVQVFSLAEAQARFFKWRKWLVRIAGIYLVGGITGLIVYYILFQEFHIFLALQLITVSVLSLLIWLWQSNKIIGNVLQWLLVLLLLFDMMPVAQSYINRNDPYNSFLRSTSELDFVARQDGVFRVYSVPGDQPYAVAASRNVEFLDGLLAFQVGHAVNAIREASGCLDSRYATSIPPCLDDIVSSAIPNAELLGRLNVRYVINPDLMSDPNFKLVMHDKENVYENLLWLPRARLSGSGTATILNRNSGGYEIALNVGEPTQLIVSETWLPGWKAMGDSGELMVTKVEGALIGVSVSPSDHVVRLVYDPLGWEIGWRVSLISLIGLCGWVLFSLAQPKRQPQ